MVQRGARLADAQEIKATIRTGRHLNTPYLHIYITQTDKPQSRVACIVSKKVAKLAVHRHRYQRMMRHAASEIIADLPQTVDMVWIAKGSIGDAGKAPELVKAVQASLKNFDRQ